MFDVCHRRYVFCKSRMENQAAIINPAASAKHGNKPDNSPKVAEYVADFQLAGDAALCRTTWLPRRQLFRVYYCELVEYREAIRQLRVKPGTFDRWMWEVRRTVGRELARRGIYPPHSYFKERSYGSQ
jgi:hypothetical protein